MMGVGPLEILIVVFIVVVLFGPTLIAFWLGFTLGRKSTPADRERGSSAHTPAGPRPAPDTTTPSEEHRDE